MAIDISTISAGLSSWFVLVIIFVHQVMIKLEINNSGC
ncbi:putative membrane protein [Escherichia coli 5-366-08_S3_C3]|nr:putative membrane protein [Escherichia coli 5-366-08_S3_C3]